MPLDDGEGDGGDGDDVDDVDDGDDGDDGDDDDDDGTRLITCVGSTVGGAPRPPSETDGPSRGFDEYLKITKLQ